MTLNPFAEYAIMEVCEAASIVERTSPRGVYRQSTAFNASRFVAEIELALQKPRRISANVMPAQRKWRSGRLTSNPQMAELLIRDTGTSLKTKSGCGYTAVNGASHPNNGLGTTGIKSAIKNYMAARGDIASTSGSSYRSKARPVPSARRYYPRRCGTFTLTISSLSGMAGLRRSKIYKQSMRLATCEKAMTSPMELRPGWSKVAANAR